MLIKFEVRARLPDGVRKEEEDPARKVDARRDEAEAEERLVAAGDVLDEAWEEHSSHAADDDAAVDDRLDLCELLEAEILLDEALREGRAREAEGR